MEKNTINTFPEWYWHLGLHDAKILRIEKHECNDYDHKSSDYRNSIVLYLDSNKAIYDNKIKEIRLFNYEMFSDMVEASDYKSVWWLSDKLTEENGRFVLEIELQCEQDETILKISFEQAEVVRCS